MTRALALLLAVGCAAPDDAPPAATDTDAAAAADTGWDAWFPGDETVRDGAVANVIRRFTFLAEEDGAVPGFDLDGVSDDAASSPCGKADLPSPDGTPGVDNQFGRMWGAVQGLVGEQVQELLQGSINEGRFLIVLELDGLDDRWSDDDVTVRLVRGLGSPYIGSSGWIAPDQTYRVDPALTVSEVRGAAVVDGVPEAGPLDFVLPIDILEADFPMQVTQGRVRIELHDDGTFTGMLGGLIDVPSTLAELLATDAAAETALVEPIFLANTDVQGTDGTCTLISTAFGYEGTTAFLVHPKP